MLLVLDRIDTCGITWVHGCVFLQPLQFRNKPKIKFRNHQSFSDCFYHVPILERPWLFYGKFWRSTRENCQPYVINAILLLVSLLYTLRTTKRTGSGVHVIFWMHPRSAWARFVFFVWWDRILKHFEASWVCLHQNIQLAHFSSCSYFMHWSMQSPKALPWNSIRFRDQCQCVWNCQVLCPCRRTCTSCRFPCYQISSHQHSSSVL